MANCALLPRARARRRHRRHRPEPRRGVPARPPGRLRREHVRGPRPRADPQPGHQPAGRPGDRARGRRCPPSSSRARTPRTSRPTSPPRPASRGEDTGALAEVGGGPEGTAEAENGVLEIPAAPSGALYYVFADADGARRAAHDRVAERVVGRPQHRARGQRRQRGGPGRQGRRGLGDRRRPRAPASTRSSARSRATARAAWRASSRWSEQGLALAALLAIGVLRRAVEEEAQREDHDQQVDARPSWRPPSAGRRAR